MSAQTPQKPLRLLSLDGGGVRGLATLLILDNLTRRIDPTNPPKPCDCFDLIGGTSTGGLIAIMLGCLEMDVQSCIDAYVELSNRVFRKKFSWWRVFSRVLSILRMEAKFDSTELEEAIKEIIQRRGKDKDFMFRDEANPDPKCKVFVCVTRGENGHNTCFRSYNSLRGTNPNCKTWEAGRATSAASTFFDPITIGAFGATYVDGATGRNNPVNEVLVEARDIWPDLDQRLQCFVSVGTGQTNFSKFGRNLVQVVRTLKNIATDTERTAEEFLRAHQELKEHHRYFRFNVTRGLEGIGLEENKKIGEMAAATGVYLESEGVRVEMEDCAKALGDPFAFVPLQPKQTIFAIHNEFTEEYDKIRSWLSPPNYQSDYGNIKAQREQGTCEWILKRDELKGWSEGLYRFLWIYGNPGCGKSVISSTVIEATETDFSTEARQKHLAYAFCDKRDESKQTPLALMKILVWQLISRQDLQPDQQQMVVAAWRAATNPGSLSNPRLSSIERLRPHILFGLFERLIAPYTTCKIVLDGLDECESPENMLRWLIDLTSTSPHIRLLLVSQNVGGIKEILADFPTIQITQDNTHADIVQYVDAHLPKILDPRKDVHLEVRKMLLGNAEGMFLWVKLAIAQLKVAAKSTRTTEARLLDVVQALPKKLEDFFSYIMERILRDSEDGLEADNTSRKQEICRVLEWVLGSFRPLRIDELQVALDLSFTEPDTPLEIRPIENNSESAVEFKDKLLSLCAPILSIQPDDTVTFVHSSLQIFLEATVRCHSIFQTQFQSTIMIHRMLATTSIRYLQSEVFCDFVQFAERYEQCTVDKKFPFKRYATQYWWLHLGESPPHNKDNHQLVSKLLTKFLNSPHVITWFEGLFDQEGSATTYKVTWGDFMLLQSKVNAWLGPSRIQDWGAQLIHKRVETRNIRVGKEHPHTLRAMETLAEAYHMAGQHKEVEDLEVQVLEVRKKVLGKDHPDTLRAMGNLAVTYHTVGRLEEVEVLEIQVLEARKKVLGKDHPDTLRAMGNLAVTYHTVGRLEEAEELEIQVLEARKKVLGKDHPDTLRAMGNLAVTYRNVGRLEEAEELQVQVLEARKKVLGKDHPDTLIAMVNLAVTYCNVGRLEEAEELEVQVLEARKKVLGKDYPDTLRAMVNLAVTYCNVRRLEEAEELGVQVLEATKKVLGKDHPDTLRAMGNLAMTYCNVGRLEEAEELGVKVLEATKKVLGKDHPDTLRAMGSLAVTYRNVGRLEEAEELQVQVLEARKKVLGKDHPDTLIAMVNLAVTYCNVGRLEEAEELEVQVLEARKKVLGKDYPDTLRAMVNLAVTYCNVRRLEEAEELGVQVLEATKKVLGKDHPDTLRAMGNLAMTYCNVGRLEEAEELGVKVLEATKKVLGKDHPDTLRAMGSLAVTYRNVGRLEEAEELQVQVLEARKKVLGKDHPDTLIAMGNLATTYRKVGQLEEAEELGVQVLEATKKVLGKDHPDTLRAMGNLAVTYCNVGRLEEAEELEVQVLEATKKVLGKDHPDTLIAMGNLAVTYHKVGRLEEAEELEIQVLEARKKVFGKDHPGTLIAMGNLAVTYHKVGRLEEAEELEVQVLEATKKVLGKDHPDTLRAMGNLAMTYRNVGRLCDD